MKRSVVLLGDGRSNGIRSLLGPDYRLLAVNSVGAALARISGGGVCAVVIDQRNGGRFDDNTVHQLKAAHPEMPIICIGVGEDYRTEEVSATYSRVRLPDDRDVLIERLESIPARPVEDVTPMGCCDMIGQSLAMMGVFSTVRKVADKMCTVLISGEPGTGKELVARALHSQSSRAPHPFVGVNCAAVPGELLENELFGHEKGSYTGADSRRVGRFEHAGRGTILLDEIGEMPLSLQVKLLRVLQEHEFERLGGNSVLKLEARVIAATNRDLKIGIENRVFRQDLYSRLNVVQIEVPPLRDRKEDIPRLVEHFLEKFRDDWSTKEVRVTEEAMELLMKQSWGIGNVRELENKIWRAICMCEHGTITPRDLSLDGRGERSQLHLVTLNRRVGEMSLPDAVSSVEEQMIQDALKEEGGVKARAARRLGISERMLTYKMKKHGIRARQ